jgi:tetratricopeptide (TPR) repeat protein
VIQAFSVPPDMAARGLTGEVLGGRLLDRIAAIDAQALSYRAPETFANDWAGRIQVEIPQTGVSVSELDQHLRNLLGERTTISGEASREPAGLTLTVRVGTAGASTVRGSDADLDGMLQQAAEAAFGRTQPFRYSKYLEFQDRREEAMAVARRLAETGPEAERPWAWAQISNLYLQSDHPAAARAARRAVELDPQLGLGYINLTIAEALQAHAEAALQAQSRAIAALRSGGSGLSDIGVEIGRWNEAAFPSWTGDYAEAVRRLERIRLRIGYMGFDSELPSQLAFVRLRNHDVAGARTTPGVLSDAALAGRNVPIWAPQYHASVELEDWAGAEARAREAIAASLPLGYAGIGPRSRLYEMRLAYALARGGELAEAQALVSRAPRDCYWCALARGQVAAASGDRAGAERWLLEAARQGPSFPFADVELGRARLSWGDPDGAIRAFQRAHATSPRHSDALHGWGEALALKGDHPGAVSKYAKAAEISPRWGRNHLRWAQSLEALGQARRAEARYRLAAGLPLSAADRASLDRALGGAREGV